MAPKGAVPTLVIQPLSRFSRASPSRAISMQNHCTGTPAFNIVNSEKTEMCVLTTAHSAGTGSRTATRGGSDPRGE